VAGGDAPPAAVGVIGVIGQDTDVLAFGEHMLAALEVA
jgi:hypothetical protein